MRRTLLLLVLLPILGSAPAAAQWGPVAWGNLGGGGGFSASSYCANAEQGLAWLSSASMGCEANAILGDATGVIRVNRSDKTGLFIKNTVAIQGGDRFIDAVSSTDESKFYVEADGKLYANSITLYGGGSLSISAGAGAPAGACTTGSLYLRSDGGAGSTLYICENTAWAAK